MEKPSNGFPESLKLFSDRVEKTLDFLQAVAGKIVRNLYHIKHDPIGATSDHYRGATRLLDDEMYQPTLWDQDPNRGTVYVPRERIILERPPVAQEDFEWRVGK